MNKKWLSAIGVIIAGIVIFYAGFAYGSHGSNKSEKTSETKIVKPKVVKSPVKTINQSKSNETWNVTLDSVETKKVKKTDEQFTAMNDFNIKKLLPSSFYMTTVEFTLENKTDNDIDGMRSSGYFAFVDGDGNSRGISGTTLSSYADVRPYPIELYPSKSKTKIQFIVLSDKNNFNSNGSMKISVPDFDKGEKMEDVFAGGTFDFGK